MNLGKGTTSLLPKTSLVGLSRYGVVSGILFQLLLNPRSNGNSSKMLWSLFVCFLVFPLYFFPSGNINTYTLVGACSGDYHLHFASTILFFQFHFPTPPSTHTHTPTYHYHYHHKKDHDFFLKKRKKKERKNQTKTFTLPKWGSCVLSNN